MPKRSSKRRETDPNRLAYLTVQRVIGARGPSTHEPAKNAHAVALGKLGGLKGGRARAEKLSPKKRKAIAKKAAQARWSRSLV